jgi:uncharacterized protein (TIGR02301 family)
MVETAALSMSGGVRLLRLCCAVMVVPALLSPPAVHAAPARPKAEKATPHKERKSVKPEPKPDQKKQEPAVQAEPPPAPYDPALTRLAEVLGGLSFLRDLCGDGDGEDWRGRMAQLRDAATPAGIRRQKLTAAFNRGFHGYELTYRSCTPNARLIISRYLDEAERLSREVVTRYGNP